MSTSSDKDSFSLTPVCLVHYHEIGLKGKNRSRFEKQLIINLKTALSSLKVQVRRISGYVLIETQDTAEPCSGASDASIEDSHRASAEGSATSHEKPSPRDASLDTIREALQIAQRIPGVARVSFAYKTKQVPDEYCLAAKRVLQDALDSNETHQARQDTTFKVHAKRSATTYELHTLELHQLVGSALCEAFPQLKVDVHKPDITVHILIHLSDAYAYAYSLPGVGGLPVGTAGKVISLFSSGFDSPVATWMLGRRGAVMVPVHFSGRPMVAQDSEELCEELCNKLNDSGIIGRLYVVPFGEVQREIALSVPQNLRILMYRRMMYAVCDRLAQLEHAKALCTGESLGQVASQTLENIYATAEVVCDLPVLRPLIGSDKQEIIARAHELETFEISATTAPDCCTLFMPKKPETHARLKDIHSAWDALPVEEMIEKLLNATEHVDFDACPAYKAR